MPTTTFCNCRRPRPFRHHSVMGTRKMLRRKCSIVPMYVRKSLCGKTSWPKAKMHTKPQRPLAQRALSYNCTNSCPAITKSECICKNLPCIPCKIEKKKTRTFYISQLLQTWNETLVSFRAARKLQINIILTESLLDGDLIDV